MAFKKNKCVLSGNNNKQNALNNRLILQTLIEPNLSTATPPNPPPNNPPKPNNTITIEI
jgi:hypothetical protein